MTSSPNIVSAESSFLFLSSRLNFFRSNVCRCASARADMDVNTSAERFKLEGIFERLLPIVMSAPIVVYGHRMLLVTEVDGSGSKQISKGCADISLVFMYRRSISILDDGRMYPAVARAGCNASAQQSLIMLWPCFLLIQLHLKE